MPDTAKNTRKKGRIPKASLRRFSFILVIIAVLDQASKHIASSFLLPGRPKPVIEGFLNLTLIHNPGAVFGILEGANVFFIFFSAAFILLLFLYLGELEKKYPGFSLSAGLIAGGATGNLIDRARLGFVIDFIDFKVWPVFNLADSAITAGAIMLFLLAARNRKKEKSSKPRAKGGGMSASSK